MSLRAFHIVFIVVSILLLAGYGFWERRVQDNALLSFAAYGLSFLLTLYLFYFISKIKKTVS